MPIFLVEDEFRQPESNPLVTPRTADGIGSWVITDTKALFTIVNGALVSALNGAPAFINLGLRSNVKLTRAASRAIMIKIALAGVNDMGLTYINDTVLRGYNEGMHGFKANSANVIGDGLQAATLPTGGSAADDKAIVLHATGASYYQKIGSVWRRVWVCLTGTVDGYVQASLCDCGGLGSIDAVRALDLDANFATALTISSANVSSPVSAVDQTGAADGLFDFSFTVPGSPVAGQTIGIRYRKSAATTYWVAYIKRNAGNTAWDFLAETLNAGTLTNRLTVTGVGTPDRIRVAARGSSQEFYTFAAGVPTRRGTGLAISFNNTATTTQAIYSAGTALKLEVYPDVDSRYDVIDFNYPTAPPPYKRPNRTYIRRR